jgi:predicted metal-dependent hydrolase
MENDILIRRTSRRRSLALVMRPDGRFEVRAPDWISQKKIDAFIAEYTPWMDKKRTQRGHWPTPVSRTWQTGDVFYLHGEPLTLTVQQGAKSKVEVDEGRLFVTVAVPADPTVVARRLVRWYRQQAQAHFVPRVAELAAQMGEAPPEVAFSNAHTRWGSCRASTRSLRLALRLLMAPKPVQDYVIVHELAHLTHMDHSPRFWALVAQYMPNWKEHAEVLRTHDGLWQLV